VWSRCHKPASGRRHMRMMGGHDYDFELLICKQGKTYSDKQPMSGPYQVTATTGSILLIRGFCMNTNQIGKQRLWIVTAVVWVLFWLFASEPWRYETQYSAWYEFLGIGISPIAIVLAAIWVRRGFKNDKRDAERIAGESKQTVTCPTCRHQVHRRSPDQTDFKCSRCGTSFRYCPHCQSSHGAA
jgi:hypothetical protein